MRSGPPTVRSITLGLLVIAFTAGAFAADDKASVDGILKQVDKVTKGVKGITAQVTLIDVEAGAEKTNETGTAFVSMDGKLRIELSGDDPKTILCTPTDLFVHSPSKMVYEQFKLQQHPERLEQYALLGFAPSGSALKKDFLITLIEESSLEGSKVALLELTPTQDDLRAAVSKIQLWIDQSTYLPIQQRMFHGSADTHLTVSYRDVSRDDKLDQAKFKPDWPKGTKKVKP
jgi:outer membrane lipoprotein-sorting protein